MGRATGDTGSALGGRGRRARRVLLIEDSPEVAATMTAALEERAGAELVHAASYAQALPLLAGSFDLIVCDYELGDGYGSDLLDGYDGKATTVLWSGVSREQEAASMSRRPDHLLVKNYESIKVITALASSCTAAGE